MASARNAASIVMTLAHQNGNSMESLSTITFESDGPVATITLNRPSARNAMNSEMIGELLRVFSALRDDPLHQQVRAVVIRAAGQAFCAGEESKDLGAYPSDDAARAAAARLDDLLRAVREAPQVVLARAQGLALGGGLGLVCVSDIAVAGYSAVFGLPEVRLGLVPAIIAPYVIDRVGATCARRLMLSGAHIGPDRALVFGLVHEVCADMELDTRLQAVLAELLQCGPGALRACKELLARVATERDTRDYRLDLLQRLRTSQEARDGIAASLRKEPPPWAPHP